MKIVGMLLAVIVSSGGSALYTVNSVATDVLTLKVEFRELRRSLDEVKDIDNTRERLRIEAVLLQRVKPDSLR